MANDTHVVPKRGRGRPKVGDPIIFRAPPELVDAVDAAAAELGITRAEWLRRCAYNALPDSIPLRTEADAAAERRGAA